MSAITDTHYKNGKMKSAKKLAIAVHWTDIQQQLKELTFKQFKEVVLPVIQYHVEKEE